ncbi:DUF1579 family protein [bacterium]|nr:DUF1579 family protein [bacterium]
MMFRTLCVLSLFLLAVTSFVHAEEEPAAPAMPTPAPELENVAFFEGDWSCDNRQEAHEMTGPAHDFKAALNVKKGVRDFWYALSWKEEASDVHPPFEASGHIGYDALAKKYVLVGVDSWGMVARFESDGWADDRFTFTADIPMEPGKLTPVRWTWEKKEGGELVSTWNMKQGDEWKAFSRSVCKK